MDQSSDQDGSRYDVQDLLPRCYFRAWGSNGWTDYKRRRDDFTRGRRGSLAGHRAKHSRAPWLSRIGGGFRCARSGNLARASGKDPSLVDGYDDAGRHDWRRVGAEAEGGIAGFE